MDVLPPDGARRSGPGEPAPRRSADYSPRQEPAAYSEEAISPRTVSPRFSQPGSEYSPRVTSAPQPATRRQQQSPPGRDSGYPNLEEADIQTEQTYANEEEAARKRRAMALKVVAP